jgi:hypothetical protein
VYLSVQVLDISIALKTCAGNSKYVLPSRYDADAPMSRTSPFVGNGLAAVAHQIGRSSDLSNVDASALIPRATGLFVQSSSAGSSR